MLYAELGVDPTVSLSELRVAFKRCALLTHPDKGGCKDAFQRVLHAFEKLSDPLSRCLYDRLLKGKAAGAPPPPARGQGTANGAKGAKGVNGANRAHGADSASSTFTKCRREAVPTSSRGTPRPTRVAKTLAGESGHHPVDARGWARKLSSKRPRTTPVHVRVSPSKRTTRSPDGGVRCDERDVREAPSLSRTPVDTSCRAGSTRARLGRARPAGDVVSLRELHQLLRELDVSRRREVLTRDFSEVQRLALEAWIVNSRTRGVHHTEAQMAVTTNDGDTGVEEARSGLSSFALLVAEDEVCSAVEGGRVKAAAQRAQHFSRRSSKHGGGQLLDREVSGCSSDGEVDALTLCDESSHCETQPATPKSVTKSARLEWKMSRSSGIEAITTPADRGPARGDVRDCPETTSRCSSLEVLPGDARGGRHWECSPSLEPCRTHVLSGGCKCTCLVPHASSSDVVCPRHLAASCPPTDASVARRALSHKRTPPSVSIMSIRAPGESAATLGVGARRGTKSGMRGIISHSYCDRKTVLYSADGTIHNIRMGSRRSTDLSASVDNLIVITAFKQRFAAVEEGEGFEDCFRCPGEGHACVCLWLACG